MKFFTSRFNFKAIGNSMVVPGIGAALLITLSTMNGCSQSDRSTESRDEVIAQNAAEAEAAEAKMAEPKTEVKTAAKPAKTEPKTPKTAPAAAPEKRKPASSAGGVYVVQVGAFKVKENAEKLQEKLSKAGYHVETQTVDHSKSGLLHLVRFQPVNNRAEAETMIEDLNSKHDLKAQIVNVTAATATATH